MTETKQLFIFGFGYTASALARQLMEDGWQISATSRHGPKRREMERLGIKAYDFPDAEIPDALQKASHLLCSISPIKQGDTALDHYGEVIAAKDWQWAGYLSTTGVYGDHGGDWVDEETPVKTSNNDRLKSRVVAERKWLAHQAHIFRLAGIYGPGRGIVSKLRKGMTRRVYKEGQVFSRCHVQDIARALVASMQQPAPGEIYNICDDLPAPAHEVAEYGAKTLGIEVPPLVDWQEAQMSEMAREFYESNRRVKNDKIKALLPQGEWLYPTYKEGILADVKAIQGEAA